MNSIAVFFLLVNALALLALPRRWAPLPLLLVTCYMTGGQGLEIGPFRFSVLRLLLLVGFLRVAVRGEWLQGRLLGIDRWMIIWAGWALFSSVFHKDPVGALVSHLGMVYGIIGVYFLIRCFCCSVSDCYGFVITIAVLLIPVALEMLNEQFTGRNLFSIFGGVPESPDLRNGRLRAQGPFSHAILAGTVGAITLPMMLGIWNRHRLIAISGCGACILMVITSASSGPIISVLASFGALFLWRYRNRTKQFRIAAVAAYILLDIVMQAPAYFLVARIDLAGGSTGWHRARLIQSSIEHINEWWFAGTDYTRHWMPTGVGWSEDHSDITNYYLEMGVRGGLPLMFVFMGILWQGFKGVGEAAGSLREDEADNFFIWSLGAALFSCTVTAFSVPFFGQSFVFLYSCLAVIASLNRNDAVGMDLSLTTAATEAKRDQQGHRTMNGLDRL